MTVTDAKWTLDQYHQMIEVGILEGQPIERLNGEIIEMSPEGLDHAQLSTDAVDYLRSLLGTRALVRDGKPITLLNSNSEPQPDLTIAQGFIYPVAFPEVGVPVRQLLEGGEVMP